MAEREIYFPHLTLSAYLHVRARHLSAPYLDMKSRWVTSNSLTIDETLANIVDEMSYWKLDLNVHKIRTSELRVTMMATSTYPRLDSKDSNRTCAKLRAKT